MEPGNQAQVRVGHRSCRLDQADWLVVRLRRLSVTRCIVIVSRQCRFNGRPRRRADAAEDSSQSRRPKAGGERPRSERQQRRSLRAQMWKQRRKHGNHPSHACTPAPITPSARPSPERRPGPVRFHREFVRDHLRAHPHQAPRQVCQAQSQT